MFIEPSGRLLCRWIPKHSQQHEHQNDHENTAWGSLSVTGNMDIVRAKYTLLLNKTKKKKKEKRISLSGDTSVGSHSSLFPLR